MNAERIAVIGGGLGGLALARRLKSRGLDVRVYERDRGASGRGQGHRISLNALGRAALEGLVDVEQIRVNDVGTQFTFATAAMKRLFTLKDADAVTVRRPALRARLLEGLDVTWDKRLCSVVEHGDEVLLEFEDGTRAAADFVVGCDGAGSKVREALGDSAPRVEPCGIVTVGGYVPRNAEWNAALELEHRGAVQYLGPFGRCLFTSFCEREDGAQRVLWALSSAGSVPSLEGAWHPLLRRLVEETDEWVKPLSVHTTRFAGKRRSTLSPSGRITLLGDAAHTMPPQRGLGGNSALEDARLLASLWGSGSLREIVEQYEAELFTRGARAVEESDESAALCHFQNPFAVFARGVALRALGAGATVRASARFFSGASRRGAG